MLSITEKEFNKLSEYIHANYGIYLKQEKMALVTGRLHSVLQHAGFDNFTDYFEYLISDQSGEAVITMIDKITTNHTFFMREADHFYYFRDVVLPYLSAAVNDRDLRIWCAACSTGEEAYTLAILVDEFLGKEKCLWDTKILATDISRKVLDTAQKGVYGSQRIEPLPPRWKSHYFQRQDDENVILTNRIRNDVIYRKFNLMESTFPFKKKFHTIFCRNVMIYFDNDTKTKLIKRFYDHMEYGGYLFIGHSESLNRETAGFKYIMPAVYRKE